MSNNQQRFVVTCPGCQKQFAARANIRGKCPQCKTEMIIDANGIASLPPAPAPTSLDALLVEDLVAGDPLASGPLAPVRHRPTSSANDGLYIKLAIGGGALVVLFIILTLVNVFSSSETQVAQMSEEKVATEAQPLPQDRIVNEITVDVVNNMPEESAGEEAEEEVPEEPEPEASAEPEPAEPEQTGPKPITCSVEEWASVNPDVYSKEEVLYLFYLSSCCMKSKAKSRDLSAFFIREAVKSGSSTQKIVSSFEQSNRIQSSMAKSYAAENIVESEAFLRRAQYLVCSKGDLDEALRFTQLFAYADTSSLSIYELACVFAARGDFDSAIAWGQCALDVSVAQSGRVYLQNPPGRHFLQVGIRNSLTEWKRREYSERMTITRWCHEWGDSRVNGYPVAAKFVDLSQRPYAYLIRSKDDQLYEIPSSEIPIGLIENREKPFASTRDFYAKAKLRANDGLSKKVKPREQMINGQGFTIDPNDLRRGAEYWESYPLKK